MALLQDIIDGAASDEMGLATLLRKCQILLTRLGAKAAEDWVEWELNGYPADAAVPDYRILPLIIRANLRDFTMRYDGWTVPPALLGKNADAWTIHQCRDGGLGKRPSLTIRLIVDLDMPVSRSTSGIRSIVSSAGSGSRSWRSADDAAAGSLSNGG